MKRLLLISATAAAFMLGGCIIVVDEGSGAQARSGFSGEQAFGGDMSLELNEPGNYRVAGGDIRLSGTVGERLSVSAGDVRAGGLSAGALEMNAGDVRFDGDVGGDVRINAADISWTGPIGGDARINTADIAFDGAVGGEFRVNMADGALSGRFDTVRINAADLSFRRDSEVSGELRANAADFEFAGTAYGPVDAAARYVRIEGILNGPAEIYADPGRGPYSRRDGVVIIDGAMASGSICARSVVITGTVNGRLEVEADEAPEIRDGGRAEDIVFTPRNGRACKRDG